MSTVLRVAYDGTDFHGWARQAPDRRGRGVRTVQGELEAALAVVCGQPVDVRGASRTDAGVHARGQIAAFERVTPIPGAGLVQALGDRLPVDVAVTAAWDQTSADGSMVRPRFGNLGKHYHYRIRCAPIRDPHSIRFEWHLARPLDIGPMLDAAGYFAGEHDFGSFRSSACQAQTTVRRVESVTVRAVDGPAGDTTWVDVDVRGEAFLHNMVRIMVGTLVEVGRGQRRADSVVELLRRPGRQAAGSTAPPQGLTLVEVRWPGAPDQGA